MKKRVVVAGLAAVAIVVVIGLVGPEPALARTSDIGKNVGEEVKSWATTLLLGIAGLVAIPVLMKRDVNGGLILALLVVLVGGFAFAPNAVKNTIESLWRAIAG